MSELRLRIFDTKGAELCVGDLVRVIAHSFAGQFSAPFYTYVAIRDGGIYPFSHFSYAYVLKADAVPDGALETTGCDDPAYDGLPKAWYHPDDVKSYGEEITDEDVRTQWKYEAMEFERPKFYRVEEVSERVSAGSGGEAGHAVTERSEPGDHSAAEGGTPNLFSA